LRENWAYCMDCDGSGIVGMADFGCFSQVFGDPVE
jgi:hypothetical protein